MARLAAVVMVMVASAVDSTEGAAITGGGFGVS